MLNLEAFCPFAEPFFRNVPLMTLCSALIPKTQFVDTTGVLKETGKRELGNRGMV